MRKKSGAAHAPHVMARARRDDHKGARLDRERFGPDAEPPLALDHVDDLVGGVGLFGAGVLAGRHRHDGGLAARGLLEDPEELAPVVARPDDQAAASIPSLLILASSRADDLTADVRPRRASATVRHGRWPAVASLHPEAPVPPTPTDRVAEARQELADRGVDRVGLLQLWAVPDGGDLDEARAGDRLGEEAAVRGRPQPVLGARRTSVAPPNRGEALPDVEPVEAR